MLSVFFVQDGPGAPLNVMAHGTASTSMADSARIEFLYDRLLTKAAVMKGRDICKYTR